MLAHHPTQFNINNFETLFSKMSQVIKNYTEDFSRLIVYTHSKITSEDEVFQRAEVMEQLIDLSMDNNDIVMIFANLIADRIEEYEKKHLVIPKPKPHEVLDNLMKIHALKSTDLTGIASEKIIHELLHEKREMNIKYIKDFSKFFDVPITLFMPQN